MEDTKTKVFCKLTETRYALKPGTKGAWQQTEQEIQDCDEQMHRRIVEAAPFSAAWVVLSISITGTSARVISATGL